MKILSKIKQALGIKEATETDLFQFTSGGLKKETEKELLKSAWLQDQLNEYIASEEYKNFLVEVYSIKPKPTQKEIFKMMGTKLTPKYLELKNIDQKLELEIENLICNHG